MTITRPVFTANGEKAATVIDPELVGERATLKLSCMWRKTFRGAFLFTLLVASCTAASLAETAQDGIRLRIPLKPFKHFGDGDNPFAFKAEAWGFIDGNGRVVISPQWDAAENFSEGLARVKRKGKWGFIDTSGKIISSPQWDDQFTNDESRYNSFSDGLARIEQNHKWGFIDKNGQVVISPQWDIAFSFSNGLAYVSLYKTERWRGFIDTTGKRIFKIDPATSVGLFFSEGLCELQLKNGLQGFVDHTGKIVIEPKWKFVKPFSEGLAVVHLDDLVLGQLNSSNPAISSKWSFIDKSGRVVFDIQNNEVSSFSGGLAEADNGASHISRFQTGFIDKTGKYTIQMQQMEASDFSNGLSIVLTGRDKYGQPSYGIMDSKGNIVVKPEWPLVETYHGYYMLERVIYPSLQIPGQDAGRFFPAEATWFDKTGKMIWHSAP